MYTSHSHVSNVFFRSVAVVQAFMLVLSIAGLTFPLTANANEIQEVHTGSVKVCKITLDADGNVITGTSGTTFTIPGFTPNPVTSQGAPDGQIPNTTYTTPLAFNEKILDASSGYDALCTTYNDLTLNGHGYYYGQEQITGSGWKTPKYNDGNSVAVHSAADFFAYSGELFDGNTGNDDSRNQNADGHITLTTERPNRTLVVLNQLVPPPACNPQALQTIYSDNLTLYNTSATVPVSPINVRWTATIPSATWIWSENSITDPIATTTETFTRNFTIIGTPEESALDVAADNSYTVSVNGHDIGGDATEFNYQSVADDHSTNPDHYTIPAADLLPGSNTISFTVTNWAVQDGTSDTNPAGLLYKLVVNNDECVTPPTPTPTPTTATIVATKIVCNNESDLPNWGAGAPDITAETVSTFLTGHQGCHLQNGWQFQWRPGVSSGDQTNPGDNILTPAVEPWTTFGPTNGSGVASTATVPTGSLIWVREVLKDGFIPFTGVNTDQNVSAEIYCSNDVLNYDNYDFINPVTGNSTYYCVAFNAPTTPPACNPQENLLQNPGFELPVVNNQSNWDVFASGISVLGWLVNWYNFNDAGGRPVTANAELEHNGLNGWSASQGVQWTEMDSDWNGPSSGLTTGHPASVALSQTIPTTPGYTYRVSFDFKPRPDIVAAENKIEVLNGTSVGKTVDASAGAEWTNNSYTFVATGATTDITFRDAGASADSYGAFLDNTSVTCQPVVTLPTDPISCTEFGYSSWGTCQSNGTQTRTITTWSPQGCTGGTPVLSQSCTYVPPTTPDPTCTQWQHLNESHVCVNNVSGGSRGHGSSGVTSTPPVGQVLGVSCGLYMNQHLRKGNPQNDPDQVKKLQQFLIDHGFAPLSVTGVFGPQTIAAVKAFQAKYGDNILKPWNISGPTGLVYLTTLRQINLIACPDLSIPFPALVPWS